MKVYEVLGRESLFDKNIITLDAVETLDDLINPETGKYFTKVVNVMGDVDLWSKNLTKLPVNFGIVEGNFYCNKNKLTSLEGAPREVDGNFNCVSNKLTSLEGIHKIIKKINGRFYISYNPIESGGIGLLLIEGIKFIHSDLPAFKIINEYLGQGKKGLLRCQEELIEAGYEEFAKL